MRAHFLARLREPELRKRTFAPKKEHTRCQSADNERRAGAEKVDIFGSFLSSAFSILSWNG
jgi:hypothetical protein